MYYGGEALSVEQPQSFTCPFCGKMGYTEATLQEHVTSEHSDTSFEVVCPVCAALPGGDPNLVTDDFTAHLTLEHRSPRDLDEPSSSRHVRRIPHPGRGVGGTRARRANMHFSSSGGIASLSPSNRDSMDPIAELLSQLSGVRRSATASQSSTTTPFQQLQMQLQLERQQISTDLLNGQAQVTRQQLDRLPRRQTQNPNPQSVASTSAASQPSVVLETAAGAPNSQFLLSRCTEAALSESDLQNLETERADRSLFVQELLLNILASNWSVDFVREALQTQCSLSGSQDTNNSPRASPPSIMDVNAPNEDGKGGGGAGGGGGGGSNSGGGLAGGSDSNTSMEEGNPPTSSSFSTGVSSSTHKNLGAAMATLKKVVDETSAASSGSSMKASSPARLGLPPVTSTRDQAPMSLTGGPPMAVNSLNRGGAGNVMPPRVVGRGIGTIRDMSHVPQGSGLGRAPSRVAANRDAASPISTRRKVPRPIDGRNQSNEPPPPH